MHTLYQALLAQHSRQLTAMQCAGQTIARLHQYFEDVVLENNLSALVVESLPLVTERPMRDIARVRDVGRAARHSFFFVALEDELTNIPLRLNEHDREPILIKRNAQQASLERFVVIADARFSALLATVTNPSQSGESTRDDVIWTFEPDIVYSALEYLMARISAERPFQAAAFSAAVRKCMPKATSLQLTVSVTTKLARLLQEQAGREIAVGRIATAIRSSLELEDILKTTVDEVGGALNVQHCALRVEGENTAPALSTFYFRDHENADDRTELEGDLNAYSVRLGGRLKNYVRDGRNHAAMMKTVGLEDRQNVQPVAAVPLFYGERCMGALMVRSDDEMRVWEESELQLLRTVADQVTVAVNHARLYAEKEQQALTDALTGCVNRRQFEIQLERDIQLATRSRQPLSLIMLDIDHFKRINDTYGHGAGDDTLRIFADVLRQELRGIDTAARYGGEEFAVILPQADLEGARRAAERLRERISKTDIPLAGHITASLGVATFPLHACTREQLVTLADRALYDAKHSGRNRVCTPDSSTTDITNEMFDALEHPLTEAEVVHLSDSAPLH
ncbi:MAG: sensor domain-containing diguanylate cyclase [Pyrinomonadaceae bacterium MAG19_C2-C3]|nr:sensor domain-containing diguanylate cyclase [Pyrinomonadaceae bacterium MAG19_C2-C3]